MKTLIFIGLLLGLTNCVTAQNLEHFEINYTEGYNSCWLKPKFDTIPSYKGNEYYDNKKVIYNMVKNVVRTFPEKIKEILRKQEVYIFFCFNTKGEIFYIRFSISKTKNPLFLTDTQWMEIYNIVKTQKLDIDNIDLMKQWQDFKWSTAGYFPISSYLRKAEENNN